jgi:hypothetical protein
MPRRRGAVVVVERRRHRRVRRRFPLLPAVGILAGGVNSVYTALDKDWQNASKHPDWVLNGLSEGFLGYDFINHHTTLTLAAETYLLGLAGYIGHKIINWLGINKYMPDRLAL